MDRINTATKATDLFGAGKHGFRNGDLAGGIAPTDLNAEWFNGMQEELLALIEAAGLAPAAGTLNQVLRALQSVAVTAPQHGQCRLIKSGANLLLQPHNGNRLIINGRVCRIPAAGVGLAPAGAVAGTLYYIYAADVNGDGVVDTLEFSATTHAADATTGVEIKNGDATRTLVGMARAIAGPSWQDSNSQRFVRSWFNDPGFASVNRFTGNRQTASTTYIELGSEIRIEFLCWADEVLEFGGCGSSTETIATISNHTLGGIDGTTTAAGIEGTYSGGYGPTNNFGVPYSFSTPIQPAEGYHFVTLLGCLGGGGGSGTWTGNNLAGNNTVCTISLKAKR